jgi:hypothetical protein
MKGNFHVQFGIGGGEGDLIADHTKVGIGRRKPPVFSYFSGKSSINDLCGETFLLKLLLY